MKTEVAYVFPREGDPSGVMIELSAKLIFPDDSPNATIKPEKPFFLPRDAEMRIRLSPSGQRLIVEFVR